MKSAGNKKSQHRHPPVDKLIQYTHGASSKRGLLCSEYPWDSKGKKGNRLRSPFRLCGAALTWYKKKETQEFILRCKTVRVWKVRRLQLWWLLGTMLSFPSCSSLNSEVCRRAVRCRTWPARLQSAPAVATLTQTGSLFVFIGHREENKGVSECPRVRGQKKNPSPQTAWRALSGRGGDDNMDTAR